MELPTTRRRSRPWLFSLCVLAAFTVLSVAALAMPRPQSTESLKRAYTDLSSSRQHAGRGSGLVVVDGDHRSAFGRHESDDESDVRSRITGMFIKKSTVCLVTQEQMELIQQVFHVEWKTITIGGVETKVLILHAVRNPHLMKKLSAVLASLDCRVVPMRVSMIIFIFNPHLS